MQGHFASPLAHEQFDICMTVLHPKQANAMVFGLMMAAVWGGLVTLVLQGLGMIALARWVRKLMRRRAELSVSH